MLLRTGWSKRTDAEEFLNVDDDGPHSPGFHKATSELLAHERDVLGVGVETVGTDAGQAGTFDPPFPNHTIMHGAGKFGLASLCNLDQLPADRRGRHRRAAEDRQRQRQPGARAGDRGGVERVTYPRSINPRPRTDEIRHLDHSTAGKRFST